MESRVIIPINTVRYQEFPELLFAKSEDGYEYFNASQYIIQKGDIKKHTIKDFRQAFHFIIHSACQIYEIDPIHMIIRDVESGHIFIEETMAFPFLSYIDNFFGIYIIERLHELFINGFTISDTALFVLTKERFDEDVLNKLDNYQDEKK